MAAGVHDGRCPMFDSKQIFERIKANQAKLDSCSKHSFSVPIDRRTMLPLTKPEFGCRWRCENCQGEVDGIARVWFNRGVEHAAR